jgi:hypothetical protein
MKKSALKLGILALMAAATIACSKDDNSSDNNNTNNNTNQPAPTPPNVAIIGKFNGTISMDIAGGVTTSAGVYYVDSLSGGRFKITDGDSLYTLNTGAATIQGQIITATIPQQNITLFGTNPNVFEGEGVQFRYDNATRTIRIQYKQEDQIGETTTKYDFTGTRQ